MVHGQNSGKGFYVQKLKPATEKIKSMKPHHRQGFTLIELLIVIVVIGILAAIALPTFLNMASRAKQSEAKINLNEINKKQQIYFLANNVYAGSLAELGSEVRASTRNYRYFISASSRRNQTFAIAHGQALASGLKSYAGAVQTVRRNGEIGPTTIICESSRPTRAPVTAPGVGLSRPRCRGASRSID
jgi:type IV pilus assembly protein PilA